MVLRSRALREESKEPGYQYALKGAQAIHYELKALGVEPVPPVRTIHVWLKEAGKITPPNTPEETDRPPRPYPAPDCRSVNDLQELDLKGPFYLTGNAQKYYLCALRDACSKWVALAGMEDKKMKSLIEVLLIAWQKLGLPKVLQMDNGLEFRGSNRYPRSLGKLVRVCLDLGVEPLFILPHEPWRNGVIENLNGLLERIFFKSQNFQDFAHLQACFQQAETAINTTHRLTELDGKTPQEFAAGAKLHFLPEGYNWRKRDLRLVKGKVSFIRIVRQSGRITPCANDKFMIGTDYQYQYVQATVAVEAHRLDISLDGQPLVSFEYQKDVVMSLHLLALDLSVAMLLHFTTNN
jgi:putative transposase